MKLVAKVTKLLDFLTPERWSKGAMYRHPDGSLLWDFEKPAKNCQFCVMGAMVFLKFTKEEIEFLQRKCINYNTHDSIEDFNDDNKTSYEDVQNFLRKAKEKAKEFDAAAVEASKKVSD